MKLRVVGWTYYNNRFVEEGYKGWAAINAVIDDIKTHGYKFSGKEHQQEDLCVPVLNDGKARRFSHRAFGQVMALAYGLTGIMDYTAYAFQMQEEYLNMPSEDREFDEDNYVPEIELNETFELTVSQEEFALAQRGKLKLDDLPILRYIDAGDTLLLNAPDKKAQFSVLDVDRSKDIAREEWFKLREDVCDFSDREKSKRANETFKNARDVLIIKLEEKK